MSLAARNAEIRTRRLAGERVIDLARTYRLGRIAIWKIVTGRRTRKPRRGRQRGRRAETAARDAYVAQLRREGMELRAIGAVVGRSAPAVCAALRRHLEATGAARPVRRRLSAAKVESLAVDAWLLHFGGMRMVDIAAQLGLSGKGRVSALVARQRVLRRQLEEQHVGLAAKVAARVKCLPSDRDDMEQEAWLGIRAAAQTFDPRVGGPFGAYARLRATGACMDALRSWYGGRRRGPQITAVLGDRDIEVALSDDRAIAAVDAREDVPALLQPLSRRERAVVRAVARGTKLRRIGDRFGLTESRICQIHGVAIRRLQQAVER